WLERDRQADAFWLDWHRQRGYIQGVQTVEDWRGLFRQHRAVYRGAVVADPELYRGRLIALNVAACEDMIVATPELAEALGLEVKIDLRGRFPTYAEAMRWVWQEYRGRLCPFLCDSRDPQLVPFGTFDTAFQWRGLMFWLVGPAETGLPGVDAEEEQRLFEEIFAELGPSPVCVGFPHRTGGFGIGEPQGVELFSRYGMAMSCNNHASNMSTLSGMPLVDLTPPEPGPAPPLDPTKVYVALALSDGDNQILWSRFFRSYFEHPAYGSFPLAIGIGPATREMQPGVIEWYYTNAAPNTEFIADVSGAAYIHPQHFGVGCTDGPAVWSRFLTRTRGLMTGMGLRCVRTVGGGDRVLGRYAAALPGCHSIFADMGRYSGRSGIADLTYPLDGKPIFRAVTSWRYGKEGFWREVHEQVADQRPAFVNGFVHCWTFGMEDLVKVYRDAGPDIELVTPTQLAKLYRQSLQAE
ncbi:MAG: hypothetical protein AAF790_15695, partial [Planctomycetota bacterium]